MVIQEYQDPRVKKYLRYGFWYVEHKGVIVRSVRFLLALAALGVWIFAAIQIYGYARESPQNQAMLRDLAANRLPVEELHRSRAPQLPVISDSYVLAGRDAQTADFMAWAENPNADWSVEIEYVFSWTGGQTLPETMLVLPQGQAVLAKGGITVNGWPESVEVLAVPRQWQRLKDRELAERLADWQQKIVVAQAEAVQEEGVTVARYAVRNDSIYDLLSSRFTVVLLQTETPVAVGVNEIISLPAGGVAEQELRWLQPLPAYLQVEVYPQIDFLDPRSYRLPAGGETKF